MKPFANRRRRALGTIIGAKIIGRAVQQEQIRESFQHRFLVLPAPASDCQAFPQVLVDHRQHVERSAIMSSIHNEVAGPGVMLSLRTTPHTGAIIQPQAAPFRLFLRYFQPLVTRDTFHPLVVDTPVLKAEKHGDAPIAVTAVLAGQVDNRLPNTEVANYYHRLDALVYPRRTSRLTELVTPLEPLEAMANRRLVLATDIGGHRELIQPEVTGLLFPDGHPEALAELIEDVAKSPVKWHPIIDNGAVFVREERNWRTSVARYESVYAA